MNRAENSGRGAILGRVQRLVSDLGRWYLTPSGVVFGLALVAIFVALVVTVSAPWLLAIGFALLAFFMPYKLEREREITNATLQTLTSRSDQLAKRIGDVAEQAAAGIRHNASAIDNVNRWVDRDLVDEHSPSEQRLVTPITFDRDDHAHIEEVDGVHRFFQHLQLRNGTMLDVGAHRGSSLRPFATSGWKVHAFEPDATNRSHLLKSLNDAWDVSVSHELVSDEAGLDIPFYSSEVSSGISSSIAFHDSHEQTATVKSTTLGDYTRTKAIDHVDFLKIDTEGADLFVLRGFPFHRIEPRVVLCEFEDSKTKHRGYNTADIISLLHNAGYTSILISEWHPIVRYGQRHDFAGLRVLEDEDVSSETWGNLIGVRDPLLVPLLYSSLASMIEVPERAT